MFLLPSQRESFGLAALEAMAARTPVIATDEGGIPEVVEHQISGYLSAYGDVETMGAHAIKLLTNEAQLQRFKEAAFARAKMFDIQKVIPLYIDIYNKALR